MKTLDFSVLQGFPASATMLQFQQEQLQQVEALALLGGTLFILSGCEVNAGIVSDGWVCINGKVYPFVGGTLGAKVIITEQVTNKNFFGGASHPYYRVPTARFGTNGNPAAEWLWANFKRNQPANGVLARLDKVEQMLAPLMGYTANVNGVPTMVHGSWLFWGRPESEIPTGWAEVTEVDWRGRFPLLKDPTNINYNTIGQLFGEANVTLTDQQMPPHSHPIPTINDTENTNLGSISESGGFTDFSLDRRSTGLAGGGQAHNNMPPARVVIFIKYFG